MNHRPRSSACPLRLVRLLAAGCVGIAAVVAAGRDVAVFPAASDSSRQGFIRVINHANRAGEVRIAAIDDDGTRRDPLVLAINAKETVHLNSDDVKSGNTAKGLDAGVGSGSGNWRLELTSDLDFEVLAYVRTSDGYLSSMHEVVAPDGDGHHHIGFFNPGDADPISMLRVINLVQATANVTITGVDDRGETPGTEVTLSIAAAEGSRTLTAEDLESGVDGLTGNLGNGTGKWRLSVSADQPVTVVNLLEGSAGLLSNLSSTPPAAHADGAQEVPLFPGSSKPNRQGFVRVINRSDEEASIDIEASDASDRNYGPITLTVAANATVQFDANDLELGNAEAGLFGGVGAGDGDWRLALSSDLDIEVLAFIRSEGGFLTPMHATVPAVGHRHRVALFNPGSNRAQASRLRLENRGTDSARVSIEGIDDRGASPGSGIELSLAGGQTTTLTARELETGSLDFDGDLGDGAGKWQLIVESDTPIGVMNLMADPTGHLTNLSSASASTAPANVSAFDDRAVGKRIVEGDGDRYIDFAAAGRYSETHGGETTTGSYTYSNTGPTTASLALATDEGSCISDLIFETRVSGRLSGCGDTETKLNWRLLEPTRHEGDRVIHEVTTMIGPLGSEVPEVLRGAATSDGVRIDLDNGGYVEMGDDRYTCRRPTGFGRLCLHDRRGARFRSGIQSSARQRFAARNHARQRQALYRGFDGQHRLRLRNPRGRRSRRSSNGNRSGRANREPRPLRCASTCRAKKTRTTTAGPAVSRCRRPGVCNTGGDKPRPYGPQRSPRRLAAAFNSAKSEPAGLASVTPNGSPAVVRPAGTASAQRSSRLTKLVNVPSRALVPMGSASTSSSV